MSRGAEARLFVALDLPADLRARLAAWARAAAASVRAASHAAAEHPPSTPAARAARAPADRRRSRAPSGRLRLLDADTLHVTLCFLGNRPVGEIEAIGDALAVACAEARPIGQLALGAPLWLPPRRPRALAVELHDDPAGALEALHDGVIAALAAVCAIELPGPTGGGAAGRARGRSFRPHVTVARLRAADAPRERGLPATPPLAFLPRSVTLHRSWLTPTEAVYEGLATHPLAVGL
jgi:RNA 2',3'-cyclic 3'-phosphodiesterase